MAGAVADHRLRSSAFSMGTPRTHILGHLLGLLGPLLRRSTHHARQGLVRPDRCRSGATTLEMRTREARVTELAARPLARTSISRGYRGFEQPLAEANSAHDACRLLEEVSICQRGYGVEIALLIDSRCAQHGLDALAECRISGSRQNRHQPLRALGEMALRGDGQPSSNRLEGRLSSSVSVRYLRPWRRWREPCACRSASGHRSRH